MVLQYNNIDINNNNKDSNIEDVTNKINNKHRKNNSKIIINNYSYYNNSNINGKTIHISNNKSANNDNCNSLALVELSFKSTLNLTAHNDDNYNAINGNVEHFDTRTIIRTIFDRLYNQYSCLCRCAKNLKNTLHLESSKPLTKQFRKSLRLNKSAKRKGYEYFISDEDKR